MKTFVVRVVPHFIEKGLKMKAHKARKKIAARKHVNERRDVRHIKNEGM